MPRITRELVDYAMGARIHQLEAQLQDLPTRILTLRRKGRWLAPWAKDELERKLAEAQAERTAFRQEAGLPHATNENPQE